jgi:hypothetical protein
MAELFELADTGKRDRLGNRVTERTSLGKVRVRVAPFGVMPTENEGNSYAASDLTLVTTAKAEVARRASLVSFDGSVYGVSRVTDLGRRRAISCSRQKGATA